MKFGQWLGNFLTYHVAKFEVNRIYRNFFTNFLESDRKKSVTWQG